MISPAECAAADRFWDRCGAERPPPPCDLRELLSRHFAVTVVPLPGLSLAAAVAWLERHGLPGQFEPERRRLHGCCIAFGGQALIFFDGGDPLAEQRFTLAHEAGHLLLDYLEPREAALGTLGPEVLPVLDGERPPSIADRANSVLADCPLGLYIHLLDRESPRTEQAEERADRFARELLASRAELATVPDEKMEPVLTERYGLPPEQAVIYAARLRQERAPAPSFLEWLRSVEPSR